MNEFERQGVPVTELSVTWIRRVLNLQFSGWMQDRSLTRRRLNKTFVKYIDIGEFGEWK